MKTKKHLVNIVISALFIGLSIIITRFFGIMVGPFFRISFGSIPIIAGSLIMGPFYGAIIGLGSDLIGATLVPTGSFLPFPMIGQIAFGVLPWVFMRLIKFLNRKIHFPFVYPLLTLIAIIPLIFVFASDGVLTTIKGLDSTSFTPLFRIVFAVIVILLVALSICTLFFVERYTKRRGQSNFTYQIAFAILLTQIVNDLIYGSIWKTVMLQTSFFYVLAVQVVILLVLLPLLTLFVTLIQYAYSASRIGVSKSSN